MTEQLFAWRVRTDKGVSFVNCRIDCTAYEISATYKLAAITYSDELFMTMTIKDKGSEVVVIVIPEHNF